MSVTTERMKCRLDREWLRRQRETLRLYQPTELQAKAHACRAPAVIFRGGNRAGKSVWAAVETCRALAGCDPHGKYPKEGLAVIIGFDQGHLGNSIYRFLFRPGLFRVIQDLDTELWRVFDPRTDRDRYAEAVAAPPLIPHRLIRKISWEDRGKHIFSDVSLTTGWEVKAFGSRQKPAQGFNADLYWLDEDIYDGELIDEIWARLIDRQGRLIWSALPHSRDPALKNMQRRALDDARLGMENPDVVEFIGTMSDNPFLPEEGKRRALRAWGYSGADVLRQRESGQFTYDDFMVFPEFSMLTHGRDPMDAENYEFKDGQLPAGWCRYAIIDPGFVVCAVLFVAVPPSAFGDFVYLEDELYLQRCTSEILAKSMERKCSGKVYRAWIIDDHGSRRTEANGLSIREQYSRAFRTVGRVLKSEQTGYGFIPGSDDKESRIAAVHDWMAVRGDGTTKLRVLKGRLPNFEAEIRDYYKKRAGKIVLAEPDDRGATHLMACLQYAAAHRGLRFAAPASAPRKTTGHANYVREKRRRQSRDLREGPRHYVNLGPNNGKE